MAKYTDEFRMKAVGLLRLLKEKGTIVLDSIEIKNVRELVHELGISSYTIYKWNKELYGEVLEVIDDSDDLDIDEQILDGDADWFGQEKKKSTGENKVKFGIDFWMHVARNLGLKNYRKYKSLAQLKLAIGIELMKQSGLVDIHEAKKELSQNGDNL